jgi:hypothetical protein
VKIWYVTKAGRVSNGFGLDSGKVNHIVVSENPLPPGSQANALCGTYPKVSWDFKSHEKPTGKVCPKCVRKLEASQ